MYVDGVGVVFDGTDTISNSFGMVFDGAGMVIIVLA